MDKKTYRLDSNPQEEEFIVWGPLGTTNPKYTFKNEKDAHKAAKNMAERFPNQEFKVMRAITGYVKPSVPVIEIPYDDGMPF